MSVHLDFETFSVADLRVVGAYRYAEDPSTEVLILAYAFDNQPPAVWLPHSGSPLPPALATAVKAGETLIAHNAQFERAIWEHVMVRKHGAPRTKRSQWHCTAARASTAGLPRALDDATRVIGLEHRKDPRGKTLVRKFCMPRKPTKKDARTRILPADDPLDFRDFIEYCVRDVRAERGLHVSLPPMVAAEHKLFALDMEINERGIPIDSALVRKAVEVVRYLSAKAHEEVERLTGGIRPTQVAKLLAWSQDHGVPLADMQADNVERMLANGVRDAKAARVLQLRLQAGKVSTKKLDAMLRCCSLHSDRVRGTILYYGAHTGRWSGKLVQPHNFIRGTLTLEEQLRVLAALEHADPTLMELLWEWPLHVIGEVMRSFIRAEPGKRLLVADYAAIEARVLAWLAGEHALLDAFLQGIDVYKLMASRVYGVPVEEVTSEQRRIGKNLVLGCGYGLGPDKFVVYVWDQVGVVITLDFSREAVYAYRDAYRAIVQYWRDVQRAFVHSARTHQPCTLRNIEFGWADGWTYIKLPSGRKLYYWDVQVKMLPPRNGRVDMEITYDGGDAWREKLYGGKLVENIVQGVARDFMASGMWNASAAGYPIISTVHDEVLAERKVGEGTLDEYVALLCKLPKWAKGCPISAEGFETDRYRKG